MGKILKGEIMLSKIKGLFRKEKEDATLVEVLEQLLQRAEGQGVKDGRVKRDIAVSFHTGLPWLVVRPGREVVLPLEYGRKISSRLRPELFVEKRGDGEWLNRVEFYAENDEAKRALDREARNPRTLLGKALRDFRAKENCVVLETP